MHAHGSRCLKTTGKWDCFGPGLEMGVQACANCVDMVAFFTLPLCVWSKFTDSDPLVLNQRQSSHISTLFHHQRKQMLDRTTQRLSF